MKTTRNKGFYKIPPFFYVVIIIFIYVFINFTQTLINVKKTEKEEKFLLKKINVFKNKNKFLKERKNHLAKDAYLESIARKKLGLVKPGEVVYKIIGK